MIKDGLENRALENHSIPYAVKVGLQSSKSGEEIHLAEAPRDTRQPINDRSTLAYMQKAKKLKRQLFS